MIPVTYSPASPPLPPHTALYLVVFEAHPEPGVRMPYFVARSPSVAYKKVEATHTQIPADELTAMIVHAVKAGATIAV